jgi:hypothetical protein
MVEKIDGSEDAIICANLSCREIIYIGSVWPLGFDERGGASYLVYSLIKCGACGLSRNYFSQDIKRIPK